MNGTERCRVIARWISRLLVLGLVLYGSAVQAFTVQVVDEHGNPVNGFKWLLEEDNTNQQTPGALVSDSLAVSIHNSHARVVKSGASNTSSAVIAVPDPAQRYVLSVLPYIGYSIGGAAIVNDQNVTAVVDSHPLPTTQFSILAFRDHFPIDNAPNVPGFGGVAVGSEVGLANFTVIISDLLGPISQDAFGNPLGTTYQTDAQGNFVLDGGSPVVDQVGPGVILTGPDGRVDVKYLTPGKYGIKLQPPSDGRNYIKTTTIEGTPTIDAWVGANGPQLLVEFGPAFYHIFAGYVIPEELPGFRALLPGETPGTVTGRVINNHLSRPPELLGSPGHPVPECWVGLNDIGGTGEGIIAQACNDDSTFSFANVPPGLYQLVIWDVPLDYIINFATVTVPPTGGDIVLGDVPVFAWFSNLEGSIYIDANQNGFRDAGETGIPGMLVNMRFRDGTVYQSTTSLPDGSYALNEIFPFFHWLISEVDFSRFKATGATVAVDAGGPIPGPDWPASGKMTPQQQDPNDPANENGTLDYRTETGPVLLEAFFGFAGQTNIIDWGKAIYGPGENGGISGIVFYAVTRAEDDPRYAVGDPWEPGIPRAVVNLYQDFDGNGVIDDLNSDGLQSLADADNYPFGDFPGVGDVDRDGDGVFDYGDVIQITAADSWDDNKPTGCIQPPLTVHGQPVPECFDNFSTWNQVRPAVFDGGYAFTTYFPGGIFAGNPEAPLPAGTYIVEAVTPPGYEALREEHKDVELGDVWTPSPLLLPPLCVGDLHVVPQYLSLQTDEAGNPLPGIDPASLIQTPFAGEMRPTCDRKQVVLASGQNAAADFFEATDVPKAARAVGFINNDFGAETNPTSPVFGEKQAPSWLPISFRDYLGNELVRVYSDEFGAYNALLPSSFTANTPSPTGYTPNMYTICLNDPGPIPDLGHPGQMILDPFYDTAYSNTCYTFNFDPGRTVYLDTPVIQVAAFVGNPNRTLDTEPPSGTPVIASVNGPTGGPLVCAAGETLTIASQGATLVANPDFNPSDPTSQPTLITRDYGFGAVKGLVTLNGAPLIINSWNDATIVVTVPAGALSGQLLVTRGDNGNVTQTGVTLHVGGCGPTQVVTVSPGQSIQAAIDTAPEGALIFVQPGIYQENLVIWRNVRLQGAGAGSTYLNAMPIPFTRVQDWKDLVQGLITADPALLLPGQALNILLDVDTAPGILVLGKPATFGVATPGLIDGFTIQGATAGGGIYVNAYGDYLTISNNRIINNSGNQGGGIHLGNPGLDSFNDHITISHNQVLKNGGINGGSGISYYAGTHNLVIADNLISGNFTRASGGAVSHNGNSDQVLIARNTIAFNEVFYGGQVGGEGGGIFISKDPALIGALDNPGAGSVTIEANLIQGNLAGSNVGGGISAFGINGTNLSYTLDILNNIIVNNIAAYAGGGIAVKDALNVNIINNTVARNDSTATAADAFVAGNLIETQPQVAGIVSIVNTQPLFNATGQAFSSPVLVNNILFENRTQYRDATANGGLGGLLPATSHSSGLFTSDYWDLGVLGAVGALDPDSSLLTSLTGMNGEDYNDGSNLAVSPLFVAPYFTTLISAQAGDEGGNFVNVYPSPLTLEGSDYHLTPASPAVDAGTNVDTTTFPQLASDYDADPRPMLAGVDIGADEVSFAHFGVFRNGTWYLDANGNRQWDTSGDFGYASFGLATDKPVVGDWNGDGITQIGVFRNGFWYLDADGNGAWNATFDTGHAFGTTGDQPVVGDWDGDGISQIGVFRNGTWYLDADGNGAWDGNVVDTVLAFGMAGDKAVTGDWNGDGITDIGVFRNGFWYLDADGSGVWNATFDTGYVFGMAGDNPVTGDWNGDGITDIGVFRGGYWFLDADGSGSWNAVLDKKYGSFGLPTDLPVIGRWN